MCVCVCVCVHMCKQACLFNILAVQLSCISSTYVSIL